MKRKVFSILFEVFCNFVVLADMCVLVLRLEQGVILAVEVSVVSLLGIIYEVLINKQDEKEEIKLFNKKITIDSNIAVGAYVVGIVVAFVHGIILKGEWPFITIMSMVCFYIGALQGKQYK